MIEHFHERDLYLSYIFIQFIKLNAPFKSLRNSKIAFFMRTFEFNSTKQTILYVKYNNMLSFLLNNLFTYIITRD